MFAGALLKEAEELLRMGLKPTEVADGYELALEKAIEVLETLSCHEVKDISDKVAVKKIIRTAVMSKQYGNEDFLADLVSTLSTFAWHLNNTLLLSPDCCDQTIPLDMVKFIRVVKSVDGVCWNQFEKTKCVMRLTFRLLFQLIYQLNNNFL